MAASALSWADGGLRYLREWKNPDKGVWYRYTLTSHQPVDPAGIQRCFLAVKKSPNLFFFKYQLSQVLAGLEVKPSLQVFSFCTQILALPYALAMCHSRATLLSSGEGAACQPHAHHTASSATSASRGPWSLREDCLPQVHAFNHLRHSKGIQYSVHTSENCVETCKPLCFLHVPPEEIP